MLSEVPGQLLPGLTDSQSVKNSWFCRLPVGEDPGLTDSRSVKNSWFCRLPVGEDLHGGRLQVGEDLGLTDSRSVKSSMVAGIGALVVRVSGS
jgi:hypothetical protein